MTYSHEVEHMCVVKKGPNHGPAPIPGCKKRSQPRTGSYSRRR